jgi:D-3-phosphoglycerate dehydrogenase / 2-oxoglutarate reductase
VAPNRKRLVYFNAWFDPIAAKILGEQPDIELVRLDYADPEEHNWAELQRAVAYQVTAISDLRKPWFGTRALFERCPNLLAVCSIGAGYDAIEVDACTQAGIIVCNQSGTNARAVAEHAVGFMFALSKKIAAGDRMIKRGAGIDFPAIRGNDLQYKTVGVVGIGHIGTRTAKICGALEMQVLACDPYLTAEQIEARGARKVQLDELTEQADFIVIHCPRSKETLGMFGAAQFARMKPNAYFINTARGGIHVEKDLVAALAEGRIAGAGIDVFDVEPPEASHPLLKFDNVVATPHAAGLTVEASRNMSVGAADQWIGLLRGEVPPRLINPEVWPLYSERFERTLGFRPAPLT